MGKCNPGIYKLKHIKALYRMWDKVAGNNCYKLEQNQNRIAINWKSKQKLVVYF